MEKIYDMVIVGGGPGGYTAAFNEVDRERWRRVGSQTGLDYHGGRRDERGNV